jgi:ABC-type Mn2+/Zn2+ transport system ATPase subunit
MKIKKIQLKNGYKRFFDMTIDLGDDPKRIVALVGSNGCGKSSVFDGMLYLNNAYHHLGQTGSKDYKYHSMNQSPAFNYKNVIVEFNNGDFQAVNDNKKSIGKGNTIFSFRSSYRYNGDLKITQSQAVVDIFLNNYGSSACSDIDGKMVENYRRLHIKYRKYQNEYDSKPSETKIKIIGDLNSSIEKCLDLKISDIGDIEAGRGTLFFTKTDQLTPFEFNVLSSGEKEVVDILLDLYLRQDEFNDTIFIIDEPELHINTSIQKKLLIEIDRMIGKNCQIWVATHSVGFLRALQDDFKDNSQIIFFDNNKNYATETLVLTPMKKNLENWKKIFETALDDLTNLISPKRIIYCEGKDKPGSENKECGLDAIVFNNIFSEEYNDTLFVSSGGNTELDQRSEIALKILNKVFSDVELWVLKDRDSASGNNMDENDRQIYLKNKNNNYRMLKRWEIENYLFDKEVLKKYCSTEGLTFAEKDYDAFVSDITNQNVKDEIGRIKNCCGIVCHIDSEVFKNNLSKCITKDMPIYQELKECIFDRK